MNRTFSHAAAFLAGAVIAATVRTAQPYNKVSSIDQAISSAFAMRSSSSHSSFVTSHCTSKNGLPDPNCTPGKSTLSLTQETLKKTLCNPHWSTQSVRPSTAYTNPLKGKLIEAYGYADTDPTHYELDHLVSLEIGGDPKASLNLWPEPYCVSGVGCTVTDPRAATDPFGAKAKDKVENLLHKEICLGKVTLQKAQDCISRNWTACNSL